MIAITLNFKTIEAARQALLEIPASSLVATTAPEAAPAPAPAPTAAPVQEPTPAPKAETAAASVTSPAIAEKAAVQEPKTPSSDASHTTSSAAASGANESSAAVEYPVLQKAVFALAGKSREAAASVASSFGVKTFKELPAEKWADALAAVNAKLAELEAA